MADPLFRRPALGQRHTIGTLYDARTDRFLEGNILRPSLPEEALQSSNERHSKVSTSFGDSQQKRLKILELPTTLAGSFHADTVLFAGASRYLAEPYDDTSVHAAVQHFAIWTTQMLNPSSASLGDCLLTKTISDHDATHMLVGIDWGCTSLISLRVALASSQDSGNLEHEVHTSMTSFATAIGTLHGSEKHGVESIMVDDSSAAEIVAYSDMLEGNDGLLLDSLLAAYEFVEMILNHAVSENGGRG